MGSLQVKLGQLRRQPRRRNPPDAESPAVYVCRLPVDQPEVVASSRAAQRDACRAELRRRIAHDRRQGKRDVEVEILAPPPPPPKPSPPARRKAVSLYEYLASKNEVDGLLRRVSETDAKPDLGQIVVTELRHTLETQRQATTDIVVAEVATRTLKEEEDDDDQFKDCMTSLPNGGSDDEEAKPANVAS